MDFDSLTRRDLQFFCKKNKIPANMTNLAMSDALKSLEIVEGIDEFLNQSPTSVAKNLPSAARTAARRKTKDETQQSELVTRSCYVSIKSLSGELEQENRDTNTLLQNPSREAVTSIAMDLDMKTESNVSKTPAVTRSTRRSQVAASTKKDESVQRVYSTRRSVRLLEESMAELCLKTKESIDIPAKKKDDSDNDDNSGETEEAEVISVRDLNDSLEIEEADDFVVVDLAVSKVSATDDMTKAESVPTGLVAEESNEIESDYETEEEDSVSDKETMDSASTLATEETKIPMMSQFEAGSFSSAKVLAPELTLATENNKIIVEEEMVVNNNEERKTEAETMKKTIDEKSLKDVSMRQLTKMVKELLNVSNNNTSA
ncbi:unnamed protein product [Cochlearia groenlandica]